MITSMLGESAGNSIGESGGAVTGTARWPVPWWKFGVQPVADRGSL